MNIPNNITRKHIIQAIKEIDKHGMPPKRRATGYALEYEGTYYAPKYVVSVANRFANGKMLDRRYFSAGKDATNDFLEARGFQIVELTSFSSTF